MSNMIVIEDGPKTAVEYKTSVDHSVPLSAIFFRDPYNYIRRMKIILFQSCLLADPQYKNLDRAAQTMLLQRIERSCYNAAIAEAAKQSIIVTWGNEMFDFIYNVVCYKVSANIDPHGLIRANLIGRLISGDIDPRNIANMSSREMCPEKYVEIDRKIESQKNVKHTVKTSKLYTCKICGKKEVEITLAQTRSLDEGNTALVRCVSCGNNWYG